MEGEPAQSQRASDIIAKTGELLGLMPKPHVRTLHEFAPFREYFPHEPDEEFMVEYDSESD